MPNGFFYFHTLRKKCGRSFSPACSSILEVQYQLHIEQDHFCALAVNVAVRSGDSVPN